MWLLLVILLVPLGSHAASPVASFSVTRTSGAAPLYVHFDASASSDADLTADTDKHFLSYTWDFGDSGAGNWSRGARSTGAVAYPKNEDIGYVAGHLYETAGTYNATLTVCDGTTCDTATSADIVVASADDTWPTTNTICVSCAGDFTGCPSGATQVDQAGPCPGDFDVALATDCNIDSAAVRCLLRAGETFNQSTNVNINNTGPSMVGSYGTGAKPIVSHQCGTACSTMELSTSTEVVDMRIMDLDMRGQDATGSPRSQGIFVAANSTRQAKQITVLRVDFLDMATSMNWVCGEGAGGCNPTQCSGTGDIIEEIAVVDCDSDSAAGNFYDLWAGAWEKAFVAGNYFHDKNPIDSHNMRTSYNDLVVVSHNTMGVQCGSCCHSLKFTNGFDDGGDGGCTAGTIESRDTIVHDNYFPTCADSSLTVQMGPSSSTVPDQVFEHYIFDGNLFDESDDTATNANALRIACGPTSVRNNIFTWADNTASVNGRYAVAFDNFTTAGDTCTHGPYYVFGNTIFDDAAENANKIQFNNFTSAIVQNNLCYFSNAGHTFDCISGSGSITYCDSDPPTADGDCNITMNSGDTSPFIVADPTTTVSIDDYDLSASNNCLDVGDPIADSGSLIDIGGQCRYDTDGNPIHGAATDCGAWERDASVEVCPRSTANLRGIQLQGVQISEVGGP